jgi:hypothetical protein
MPKTISPEEVRKVERNAQIMGLRMLVLCERLQDAKTGEQALTTLRGGLLADIQKLAAEDPEAFYLTMSAMVGAIHSAVTGPNKPKPAARKQPDN